MSQILLTIAYVGTDYCGFQVQKNGISVQQVMQDALEGIYGRRLPVRGCSRTDAGVHARDFKLSYFTDETLPDISCDTLPRALNSRLPETVSVLGAHRMPDAFHVRYDVREKEYEYLIDNAASRNPFHINRVWHYPVVLDTVLMQTGADYFVGTHDFVSFMAAGSKVCDTVRTVKYLHVERIDSTVRIRICADGFLYNMVRIIVGTLTDVSAGKINAEDIPQIIQSKSRANAGRTAPADGLYLNRVSYGQVFYNRL